MGGEQTSARATFVAMFRRGTTEASQARVDGMIARARELFIRAAEKHALALEWDEDAPVELAANIPKQTGLDWSLWLSLQNNDEIGIQHEFFWVEWFPADSPDREAEFARALDGLLSGTVRLVCKFGSRGRRPYAVSLEEETDSGWRQVSGYARGVHLGTAKGIMILRNGHVPFLEGRAVEVSLPG